jgi:hypothetical protein
MPVEARLYDEARSASLRRQEPDDLEPFSACALIDRMYGRRHREPS